VSPSPGATIFDAQQKLEGVGGRANNPNNPNNPNNTNNTSHGICVRSPNLHHTRACPLHCSTHPAHYLVNARWALPRRTETARSESHCISFSTRFTTYELVVSEQYHGGHLAGSQTEPGQNTGKLERRRRERVSSAKNHCAALSTALPTPPCKAMTQVTLDKFHFSSIFD
jgi:hypothetical protein